jgi:hypothetical protein
MFRIRTPGLDLLGRQTVRQFENGIVRAIEFGISEEPEEFDRSQLAPLLSNVSHLHNSKYQASYDHQGAEDLGHIGKSRQIIHRMFSNTL